jgi:hypothetical protein
MTADHIADKKEYECENHPQVVPNVISLYELSDDAAGEGDHERHGYDAPKL